MIALRSQKLKTGLFSLYLDIYYKGSRNYEFLELQVSKDYTKDSKRVREIDKEIWELANSIRAKRELEIKNDEHGFVAGFKKKGNFIDYFQSKLAVKNHRSYDCALVHLKEFAGEKLPFSAINEQWVNRFREYLLQAVESHNTAFCYYMRVKIILNMAVKKDKIIIRNPYEQAEPMSPKPGKRPHLEFEQLQMLYNTSYGETLFEIHSVKGFLFACFAGLRLSDTIAFKWTDLYNGKISYTQKKTDKNEYLPLPEQALKILETMERSPDSDRVFFGLRNASYEIGLVLNKWAKEAKVDKYITFHVARHTFATLLITYDVDLYTVSKLLGHSDIRMTQEYAKVVDKKKLEAVNKLPNFTTPPMGQEKVDKIDA